MTSITNEATRPSVNCQE